MKREGFVPGIDGAPLFYRLLGPDQGPTFVFCDGVGCAGYAWPYLIEANLERHRMVHLHYRGHGLSAPPRDKSRLEITDHAADVVRVLEHLGIDDAVLVGHSMGVQVILEVYRAAPERVRGLVPMCGSYGHVLDTLLGHTAATQLFPRVAELLSLPYVRHLLQAIWSAGFPTRFAYRLAEILEINPNLVREEDFVPYLRHMGEMDTEIFLRCLAAAARHTAADLLPSVRVPTLIIAGEHDGMTPAWLSQEMMEAIPGAELVFVPEGSHTAPIELPEMIVLRVERFLQERVLAPPPPPAERPEDAAPVVARRG